MLDQAIFSAINGLAGTNPTVDWIAVAITSFGVAFLALLILVTRKKDVVFKGIFSFLFSSGIAFSIKQIMQIPRPDATAVAAATNYSFPSGHSANAFALATTLYFYDKRIGIPALIFAAIIGISRIFVGAHWPSDVIVGAALGIGAGYLVEKQLNKTGKQGKRK